MPPLPERVIIPNFMQKQLQSNWCWAACATSVGLYFKTGSWTQCGTANYCIPSTSCWKGPSQNCCSSPSSCNCYGALDQALKYTKSFNEMRTGPMSATDIPAQIKLMRPICVRVLWNAGGAHFMAITGFQSPIWRSDSPATSAYYIYLQDPIYGSSSMLYTDFPSKYQGGGTWTYTYLTQPQ